MNLENLATLKQLLTTSNSFGEVLKYFMDEFGMDTEFIALGNNLKHPFLEAIIPQIGKQIFGDDSRVQGLLLTQIPERDFTHGALFLNGNTATIFYFEDIPMGLLGVSGGWVSSETKVVRFTGKRLRSGVPEPSIN